MAGLGIRLYTDEMIPGRLADVLRRRGYDVVSCHEVGRANRAIPDEDQLSYAAQDGRAILTFNMVDYVPLDQSWKAAGHHHYGIRGLACHRPVQRPPALRPAPSRHLLAGPAGGFTALAGY